MEGRWWVDLLYNLGDYYMGFDIKNMRLDAGEGRKRGVMFGASVALLKERRR